MAEWQVVLDRQPFDLYCASKTADRAQLRRAFDELEAHPLQAGLAGSRDKTGRDLDVRVFGRFVLHYWDDFLVKELRVVRIERLPRLHR